MDRALRLVEISLWSLSGYYGCLTVTGLQSYLPYISFHFTAIADHPGGVKQQKVRTGTSKGRAVTHTGIAQSPPGASK